MTVRDKLQQKYNTLTPSYRKVCTFLLENYDHLEQLSIQEIGERCGSSLSTIFRLCQKVGYAGFRDLRDGVLKDRHLLETRKSKRFEDIILQFEISMIEELRGLLRSENFRMAVTRCAAADKLLWIGIGDSANVLPFADYRCSVLEIDSAFIADPVRYIMGIDDLTGDSVVLMISQSGNTKLLRDATMVARESPATFIGLTTNGESFLAQSVDIAIVVPSWDLKTTKHHFAFRGPETVFLDLFLMFIGLEKGSISQRDLESVFAHEDGE